jgi:hypothetical protein
MDPGEKDLEHLKGQLYNARLIEYSVSFMLTIVVSIVVLFRVRCQLEGFTYLVMAILLFS